MDINFVTFFGDPFFFRLLLIQKKDKQGKGYSFFDRSYCSLILSRLGWSLVGILPGVIIDPIAP